MSKVTFDFTDERYVVTGATSGMGRQVALELAAAGAKVLAIGRNADRLQEIKESYPNNIYPAQLDVCDSAALEEAIKVFVAEHGKLNGGVHAAGIYEITPIKNYDVEGKINKKDAFVKDEFIRNETIKIKKEKDTSPINNIITVARNNFTKLLSCNIGDEIIVKNSRNLIKMEILNISNPYGINEELDGKVKISVARKNFNVIENVGSGGVIIIKHKNYPGQIDLKII